MRQEQFVQRHSEQWDQFSEWLRFQAMSKSERQKEQNATNLEWHKSFDFPARYRQLCQHLALARSRQYSQPLLEKLDSLVLQGHQKFYKPKSNLKDKFLSLLLVKLPQTVRQEWRVMLISSLLFMGTFIAMIVAVQINPDIVYSVIDPYQIQEMEAMYEPQSHARVGKAREADSDVLMFGFYIMNNTSIGFRTFAGGLAFGLGSIFALLFNGIVIGTVAGHLTHLGFIETFWGFVSGHSAMELTAIIISGAAGLKLGAALIRPGQKSRLRALRDNANTALVMMYGAAAMFFMAAFIEAFWSPMTIIPVTVKYVVGILLWLLVIGYYGFVGQGKFLDES